MLFGAIISVSAAASRLFLRTALGHISAQRRCPAKATSREMTVASLFRTSPPIRCLGPPLGLILSFSGLCPPPWRSGVTRVRAKSPALPCVVITGRTSRRTRVRMIIIRTPYVLKIASLPQS